HLVEQLLRADRRGRPDQGVHRAGRPALLRDLGVGLRLELRDLVLEEPLRELLARRPLPLELLLDSVTDALEVLLAEAGLDPGFEVSKLLVGRGVALAALAELLQALLIP